MLRMSGEWDYLLRCRRRRAIITGSLQGVRRNGGHPASQFALRQVKYTTENRSDQSQTAKTGASWRSAEILS